MVQNRVCGSNVRSITPLIILLIAISLNI